MIYGIHVSISEGFVKAAQKIHKLGGNAIQIFVKPSKQYIVIEDVIFEKKQPKISKIKTEQEYNKFNKLVVKHNITVFVHSSYTLNFCRSYYDSYQITSFINEMKIAEQIGAKGIVLHCGKQLDIAQKIAYNNMIQSVIISIEKTRKLAVKILLETPTGQGTEIGFSINKFGYIYKNIYNKLPQKLKHRIGICIDTCHIFAAGYSINNKKEVSDYLEMFNKSIGYKHIKLIHLNNSRTKLNSHVDRHDNLTKGYINIEGLKYFYLFAKKHNIPVILETPEIYHQEEIKLLEKW